MNYSALLHNVSYIDCLKRIKIKLATNSPYSFQQWSTKVNKNVSLFPFSLIFSNEPCIKRFINYKNWKHLFISTSLRLVHHCRRWQLVLVFLQRFRHHLLHLTSLRHWMLLWFLSVSEVARKKNREKMEDEKMPKQGNISNLFYRFYESISNHDMRFSRVLVRRAPT